MNNLPRVAIIAIAIIIAAIATVGIVAWIHSHHTQPAIVAQTTTSKQTAAQEKANATAPSDAQMSLAIVHKGEGVESALIRQFAANPAAYGFSGKQDDTKAIHQWAGRQAHLLAIKAGYYDWKFGAEVRVATSDKIKMAYVIQKDAAGNLTVVEYTVAGPQATPTFSQGATHIASATVGTSNFFGASPTTGDKLPVPHGEYVYFPGE